MMMSGIGNRGKGKLGFTFIEIMVTTVVFALGMGFIYYSLFMSLYQGAYIVNRLRGSLQVSNKIWEMQDSLRQTGGFVNRGIFSDDSIHPGMQWSITPQMLNAECGFWALEVKLADTRSKRHFEIARSAYINP
jgi:prepilin-type N-terminal cleavage/methylation domain-containing protein